MAVLRLAEPIDFCIAFLISYTVQDLWTVFSNGTNKQGVRVYLEWEEGEGEYRREGRRGKKDMVEGEWRKVGDEGVILLLEPVALTLTVAWKQNQSVSIHTKSGFMWADSVTWAQLLPTTACSVCVKWLFKFHCLLLLYAEASLFIYKCLQVNKVSAYMQLYLSHSACSHVLVMDCLYMWKWKGITCNHVGVWMNKQQPCC